MSDVKTPKDVNQPMSQVRRCPNCNSDRFIDVPAREYCSDCGLECNYRGGGANAIYKAYTERKWAAEEWQQEQATRAYMDRTYGEGKW
jgi:hypothetical protein